MTQTTADVVRALLAEDPSFHGGGQRSWAVDTRLVHWLAEHVPAGGRTLETGSGHSTVAFLTRSGAHVVVTPFGDEVGRIRAWCAAHDVDTGALVLEEGPSQRVLPRLVDDGPLDVVLIDGDHAFPAPAIDWYYTAERVRVGGHVLVDDTQLRPCRLLRDFLAEEPGWEQLPPVGRTAVFRRTSPAPVTAAAWFDQPWSALGPYAVGGEPLAERVQLLRVQLRLRTRLRRALARRHDASPSARNERR